MPAGSQSPNSIVTRWWVVRGIAAASDAARQQHVVGPGIKAFNLGGPVAEHGALVDGTLVGDLAAVDRRWLGEDESARDARRAAGAGRPQHVDEALEELVVA